MPAFHLLPRTEYLNPGIFNLKMNRKHFKYSVQFIFICTWHLSQFRLFLEHLVAKILETRVDAEMLSLQLLVGIASMQKLESCGNKYMEKTFKHIVRVRLII